MKKFSVIHLLNFSNLTIVSVFAFTYFFFFATRVQAEPPLAQKSQREKFELGLRDLLQKDYRISVAPHDLFCQKWQSDEEKKSWSTQRFAHDEEFQQTFRDYQEKVVRLVSTKQKNHCILWAEKDDGSERLVLHEFSFLPETATPSPLAYLELNQPDHFAEKVAAPAGARSSTATASTSSSSFALAQKKSWTFSLEQRTSWDWRSVSFHSSQQRSSEDWSQANIGWKYLLLTAEWSDARKHALVFQESFSSENVKWENNGDQSGRKVKMPQTSFYLSLTYFRLRPHSAYQWGGGLFLEQKTRLNRGRTGNLDRSTPMMAGIHGDGRWSDSRGKYQSVEFESRVQIGIVAQKVKEIITGEVSLVYRWVRLWGHDRNRAFLLGLQTKIGASSITWEAHTPTLGETDVTALEFSLGPQMGLRF